MDVVVINTKNFQYLGRKLRDDDIFDLAIQKKEKMIRYASERLRKKQYLNNRCSSLPVMIKVEFFKLSRKKSRSMYFIILKFMQICFSNLKNRKV